MRTSAAATLVFTLSGCGELIGLSDYSINSDAEKGSGGSEPRGVGGQDASGGSAGGHGTSSGGSSGNIKQGASCGDSEQCQSGSCVDGLCCESACDGVCESCHQDGSEGICLPHASGTDPEMECTSLRCGGDSACASCENGITDGLEEGPDCGGECAPCAGALLLSELADSPTTGEFIEIYNTANYPVSLKNVYLADVTNYYEVTTGLSTHSSDFQVRFPDDALIAGQSYLTVSLEAATHFQAEYGAPPNFDLDETDNGAPAMVGTFTANSGLTDGGEVVALFYWNGRSNLVQDIDILVYEPAATVGEADTVDKSGVMVGDESYASETAKAQQSIAADPTTGGTISRCDNDEGKETKTGGNSVLGHDETSENLLDTWAVTSVRSPGEANACN